MQTQKVPKVKYLGYFLMCFILMVSRGVPIVSAETVSVQEQSLKIIADFADRLCKDIPLVGSGENQELSGKARVEVNQLLKKLANIGIEGTGKYQETKYEGLLRQDLAKVLKNSTDCKLEVFRELKDELLVRSNQKHESCIVELISPKKGDTLSQNPIGGGKYQTNWNFFWRDCPEANQYHLYVIGPYAINPVVDDDNIKAALYQKHDTHYGIDAVKGWSWKVRAKVDGNWGEWSQKWMFNVNPKK